MQTALAIIIIGANVCLVGGGIYLSSYLKKKAEGLATKEDFKDLKEQTAELTRTTKKIEAEINNDVWNRQKRWEMKREVIFDMSKQVSAVEDALSSMYSTHKYYRLQAQSGQIVDATTRNNANLEASQRWGKAADAYDSTVGLMNIVCSIEICQTLREFIIFTRQLASEVKTNPQSYYDSLPDLGRRLKRIQELMRNQLGVDTTQA
jgi:hypothetical protein